LRRCTFLAIYRRLRRSKPAIARAVREVSRHGYATSSFDHASMNRAAQSPSVPQSSPTHVERRLARLRPALCSTSSARPSPPFRDSRQERAGLSPALPRQFSPRPLHAHGGSPPPSHWITRLLLDSAFLFLLLLVLLTHRWRKCPAGRWRWSCPLS
jgi:hypothetical protein